MGNCLNLEDDQSNVDQASEALVAGENSLGLRGDYCRAKWPQ